MLIVSVCVMAMRISSYNCRSVKLNVQSVRDLCAQSDIICLQETWLPVQELSYLSLIDRNFSSYGSSPVDLSHQVLDGRPYGGVAIMYRKNLHPCISCVPTTNKRLISIDVSIDSICLRLINCYMPYDNGRNIDEYLNVDPTYFV